MSTAYDYTDEYVSYLRLHCLTVGVDAPAGFWVTSVPELVAIFNGIGPDRWSSRFRKLTSWLLSPFMVAALVHDWEYSQPEKSYWAFTKANLRFAWNGLLEGLWEKHLALIPMGALLALLCQIFGYGGYQKGSMPDV